MSKVLVVMPCYNTSDTLYDTILSIDKQIYKNYILVCCDDKSTDDTLKLLEDYKKKFNFELLNNDINLGTGEIVNKCIDIYTKLYDFSF